MADSAQAPETTTTADPSPISQQPQSETRPSQLDPSSAALPSFSSPNPSAPPPPSVLTPPPPPIHPSFRPAGTPVPVPSAAATPQFSPVTYQTPGVPPPGVVLPSAPAVGSGPTAQAPLASLHPVMMPHYALPGQPIRYAPPMPNGYQAMPQHLPQGAMPPGGFSYLFLLIFMSLQFLSCRVCLFRVRDASFRARVCDFDVLRFEVISVVRQIGMLVEFIIMKSLSSNEFCADLT